MAEYTGRGQNGIMAATIKHIPSRCDDSYLFYFDVIKVNDFNGGSIHHR